jgi:hypothetical protein
MIKAIASFSISKRLFKRIDLSFVIGKKGYQQNYEIIEIMVTKIIESIFYSGHRIVSSIRQYILYLLTA